LRRDGAKEAVMSAHANSRIKAGLEARAKSRGVALGAPSQAEIEEHNRQTAPTPVTSVEVLTGLALQAEAAHAGLTQLIDQTSAQIHEEREGVIANLRHYGLSLAEAQNHPLAGGVLSTHVQATTDKRLDAMASLIKAAAVAEASAPLFSSPAAMLQSAFLGNPKRREYAQDLANAGPNEIMSLSVRARATNDPALASALLQAGDRPEIREKMPKGWRTELADQFYGAHHKAAVTALSVIKGRLRSAQLASNSFARTGRRSAESMLSHGLNVNRERG
jgi:hypothetical protein